MQGVRESNGTVEDETGVSKGSVSGVLSAMWKYRIGKFLKKEGIF